MATSVAAVRLQPWPHQQPEVVHKFMDVAQGYGGSSGVRVRAHLGTSQPRGRICKVPLFRTLSSPRREALVSAMSEEHDITGMQETDKVSGEWWKPILTAVHDWSQDKLLGLAELADGSLFFSFGPESESKASPKASSSPQLKAHSESSATTPPLKTSLPQRLPSSFRKHSPIPKKASEMKKTAKEEAAAPTAQPPKNNQPPKKEKAKSPSKPATQPQRPPSSFSKRSPIPKPQVPASISKKKSQVTTPAVEAPSETTASDSTKDSPLSPELKEILNRGKESAKSNNTSTSGGPIPAKKKVLKVVREETVVEVVQTVDAAAVESEETAVEVVAENNGAVSTQDLGSYKLPELRSLAKAKGLKGYSKLKKGELVDLLAGLES